MKLVALEICTGYAAAEAERGATHGMEECVLTMFTILQSMIMLIPNLLLICTRTRLDLVKKNQLVAILVQVLVHNNLRWTFVYATLYDSFLPPRLTLCHPRLPQPPRSPRSPRHYPLPPTLRPPGQ